MRKRDIFIHPPPLYSYRKPVILLISIQSTAAAFMLEPGQGLAGTPLRQPSRSAGPGSQAALVSGLLAPRITAPPRRVMQIFGPIRMKK